MRRLRQFAGALVALALAAAPSGCATLGGLDLRGHKQNLKETQLKYAHFLRWGEYQAASYLVQPDLREAFLIQIEPFDDVRLSDYEVLDTEFNPTRTEATVMVSFSAYHLHRLIEHRWTEKQIWKRDLATQQWQVKPDIETLAKVVAELQPER
jgi:hypothetical protein